MKKHILVVVAALSLGCMAFGQAAGPRGGQKGGQAAQGQRGPGGGGRMMGGGMGKQILDQLNLSADQKKKIEALNKAMGEKMKAMRDKAQANGQKPNREAMKAQFTKMRDEHNAGLKKILTSAQYDKYQKLMKDAMAKMEKERAAKGGKPDGQRKAGGGGGR